MTPRNRHARTESVPHSDFGAQEFYDEDDLEEAGPAPENAEPAVADSAFAPRPSEVADAADALAMLQRLPADAVV